MALVIHNRGGVDGVKLLVYCKCFGGDRDIFHQYQVRNVFESRNTQLNYRKVCKNLPGTHLFIHSDAL